MAGLADYLGGYNVNNIYNGGITGNFGTPDAFGNTGYQWTPDANTFNISNNISPSNSGGWFSGANAGSTLSGLAAVGSGIMSGIQGFQAMKLAKKNLGLAKEQFAFQKGLANRNLANQAKIINNTYDTAASVAGAQAGKFGMVDQGILDKYAQVAKEKHVDATPI